MLIFPFLLTTPVIVEGVLMNNTDWSDGWTRDLSAMRSITRAAQEAIIQIPSYDISWLIKTKKERGRENSDSIEIISKAKIIQPRNLKSAKRYDYVVPFKCLWYVRAIFFLRLLLRKVKLFNTINIILVLVSVRRYSLRNIKTLSLVLFYFLTEKEELLILEF